MEHIRLRIKTELERIRQRNPDGLLVAEEIVEAARAEDSLLHPYFEWDDQEAARLWRLEQARGLVQVIVENYQDGEPYRAFVSLISDRNREGGGYRILTDVLATDILRQELLEMATKELETVKSKYQTLTELADVWAAIERTPKPEKKQRKPAQPAIQHEQLVPVAA